MDNDEIGNALEDMSMKTPNQYRIKTGPLASDNSIGNNGAFAIPYGPGALTVIASDGEDWEHVSVSHVARTPTWAAMCYVKNLFWDMEECIIQYHPPKSQYVNCHDYCLHLWKPPVEIPIPPMILIGPAEVTE